MAAMTKLERACEEKGLKMTEQRRVIARVIADAEDHPDVETVYRRATAVDPRISIATVYRSLKLFEDANVLVRHDFGEGRARYEETGDHHEHLIDIETGEVIEFMHQELEALKERVANELGYELVDHRLELYGRKLKS
jgi:Fur family transcriptional regulator, ferric uptake regulator